MIPLPADLATLTEEQVVWRGSPSRWLLVPTVLAFGAAPAAGGAARAEVGR